MSDFILSDANLDVDAASKALTYAMSNKFITSLKERVKVLSRDIDTQDKKYMFYKYVSNMIDNIEKNFKSYLPIVLEKQKRINEILNLPFIKKYDIISCDTNGASIVLFIDAVVTDSNIINQLLYGYPGRRDNRKRISGIGLSLPISFNISNSIFNTNLANTIINEIRRASDRYTSDPDLETFNIEVDSINRYIISNLLLCTLGFDNLKIEFTPSDEATAISTQYSMNLDLRKFYLRAYNTEDNKLEDIIKNINITEILEYISTELFSATNINDRRIDINYRNFTDRYLNLGCVQSLKIIYEGEEGENNE